jgi:hypothetical protein
VVDNIHPIYLIWFILHTTPHIVRERLIRFSKDLNVEVKGHIYTLRMDLILISASVQINSLVILHMSYIKPQVTTYIACLFPTILHILTLV